MVIRGLKSFLKYCSKACYQVHLPNIISIYRNRIGRNAEIVVDGDSCLSIWCDDLHCSQGFDIQRLLSSLTNFVEAFKEANAELVFFMSGVTSDSVPSNLSVFVSFVLKHVLNCKVYITEYESVGEIIRYVFHNDSFAILADNMDFVVSQINCVVLCARSYNSQGMTAVLYDRQMLSVELNINVDQLPVLAVLARSDLVPPKLWEEFLLKIRKRFRKRRLISGEVFIPALGNYISKLLLKNICRGELMKTICRDVFNDYTKVSMMRQAHDSYFPDEYEDSASVEFPDEWNRVLSLARERVRNVLLPVSVWDILNHRLYDNDVVFKDIERINDGNDSSDGSPVATVTLSLRSRLYGILFYDIQNSRPTVTECIGDHQARITMFPKYPTVDHPGLIALWDDSLRNLYFTAKWLLFLKAVSPNIGVEFLGMWFALPNDLIVSTATCYYLFEENFLNQRELRAVIATLVMYPRYGVLELGKLAQEVPDSRAVQISLMFCHTYDIVFSLWTACGYPFRLSANNAFLKFESKLFAEMYRRSENAKVTEMCDFQYAYVDLFTQINSIVVGRSPEYRRMNHSSS